MMENTCRPYPLAKEFIEALIKESNFSRVQPYLGSLNGKTMFPVNYDFDKCERYSKESRFTFFDWGKAAEQECNYADLSSKNLRGYDLYWMPSISKIVPREPTHDQITQARALFVDIDHQFSQDEIGKRIQVNRLPQPTYQTKTFKGWQLLWIFNKSLLLRQVKSGWVQGTYVRNQLKDTVNVALYDAAQKRLVEIFDGDKQCLNLNRKMRIPNTYRWKGAITPFYCEATTTEPLQFYRFADFKVLLPSKTKSKRKRTIDSGPTKTQEIIPVNWVAPGSAPLDPTKNISMDEFNRLVDEVDFRREFSIPKTKSFRCVLPEHEDVHPSARCVYKKGKWQYHCHCQEKPMDYRDFLQTFKGMGGTQAFEYLKRVLDVGGIQSEETLLLVKLLNRRFEVFENALDGFPQGGRTNPNEELLDIRLVCSKLRDEALQAANRGHSTFTLSTNHLTSLTGFTKKKSVGIQNILVYLGVVTKTISSAFKKFGRGISEFEFLDIDPKMIAHKLAILNDLGMTNPERFNRAWVESKLGQDEADRIYLMKPRESLGRDQEPVANTVVQTDNLVPIPECLPSAAIEPQNQSHALINLPENYVRTKTKWELDAEFAQVMATYSG